MKSTISRNEIMTRMESGASMTLIEALPKKHYLSGHLPGAINIPHTEIEVRAGELLPDRDALIVVYCASLACRNSALAAQTLGQLGYRNVRVFAEGKQDWSEAGLPMEGAQS
jgi:rhodanese-related sulfurtransferase